MKPFLHMGMFLDQCGIPEQLPPGQLREYTEHLYREMKWRFGEMWCQCVIDSAAREMGWLPNAEPGRDVSRLISRPIKIPCAGTPASPTTPDGSRLGL